MKKLHLIIVWLSTVMLVSCGSGGDSGLSGEVKIDGSSTVYPITEAIAEEFRSVAPGVRVTVGVSGTGGGFKKFLRGETSINDASRMIKQSEVDLAEKNNVEYVRLAVAYDGLAIVVHPENDWVNKITVEELKNMWEPEAQQDITHWNQVRPEWPDEELHLYGPGVASGTYDYFTEAIVGESGASRGDFTASEDDNVLVQGISTDKYALGYFGIAYFEENQEKLKLLAVDDGDGNAVKPTAETVSQGTYKPLSRELFIYVSKSAAENEAVQKFVNFYLETADDIARQVGYIPMPDSMYQKQLDKFKAFYAGDSVASDTTK